MSTIIDNLLRPINASAPQGEPLAEHPALDTLEEEMMKYGTLRQSDIKWDQAVQSAESILKESSKDFKVMSSLIICWISLDGSLATVNKSLQLLKGMLLEYWETGYPVKGKTGYTVKNSSTLRSIKKLYSTIEKLTYSDTDVEDLEAAIALVKEIKAFAQVNNIDDQDVLILLQNNLLDTVRAFKDNTNGKAKPSIDDKDNKKRLADRYPEKEIKSFVFDLSQEIHDLSPEDPLSYQLRRYGIWHSITSAPLANAANITELRSPPNDKINDYKDQIYQGRGSYELLAQIENSLTLCPLWITGSLLSTQVQFLLGNDRAAVEIFHQIETLLKRVPNLKKLLFVGEIPFCDEELYANVSAKINNRFTNTEDDAQADIEELIKPAANSPTVQKSSKTPTTTQLKSLIAIEKRAFNKNLTPRESCYNKLEMLEKMKRIGMKSSAAEIADSVLSKISDMEVAEWEPDVIDQFQSYQIKNDKPKTENDS